MALLTLEGIYEDGQIALGEKPVGVHRARVMVTFLPEDDPATKEAARRAAGARMIAQMKEGLDFGGSFDRAEIYEERMRQLDERRAERADYRRR